MPPPPPSDIETGICLYTEPGFAGDVFCLTLTAYSTDVVNLSQLADAAGLEDRIASVQVFGAVALDLFSEPFGQGTKVTLTESAESLPDTITALASSLHLYDVNECETDAGGCSAGETCRNTIGGHVCNPVEVCFYDGAGRTGASYCSGRTNGVVSLPATLDGKVTSVSIQGTAIVTLHAMPGGTGPSRTITRTTELTTAPVFNNMARAFSVRAPGIDALPNHSACMSTATDPPPASARVALTRVYDVNWIATTGGAFSPTMPGRLYMAEKTGTVSFADPASVAKTVALDLSAHTYDGLDAGVLNIAFSPAFATDGALFVVYNRTCADAAPAPFNPACPNAAGFVSRIARFTSADGGVTFNPATEQVILDSFNPLDNHTFGAIVFGPDGMMYVGTGDGGNLCAQCQANGQNLASVRAKILRLDVTSPAVVGGITQPGCVSTTTQRYCIPADNPYAGNAMGYAEDIWAYGLRNPWKISFDAAGRLWAGDVGQDTYEEVNLIERGGNYGWATIEGTNCYLGSPAQCADNGLRGPIAWYDHATGGNSITSGHIYRGSITDLTGAFVFADFVSHRVWALWEDGLHGQPQDEDVRVIAGHAVEQLFTTDELIDSASLFVPSFLEDAAGELYIVVAGNEFGFNDSVGEIYRFDAPEDVSWGTFPTVLSQTGCFTRNAWTQAYTVPSSELLPYDLNAPFWSDGASKRRYVALPTSPSGSRIAATVSSNDGDIDFPIGTVLVKEFSLEGRRVETRFMVRHDDGAWGGYTYRWRADQLDADLVPAGRDEPIGDVTWHYPTRAECLQCHGAAAGRVLGPEVRQLARAYTYAPGRRASELDTWGYLGLMPWLDASDPALARYTLDEGNGTIAHDATSAYPQANIVGNATWQATTVNGIATSALTFDGTTSIPLTVPSGAERTLAAWIKPSSSAAVQYIESVIDADVPGQYGTGFGLNGGFLRVILDDEFWVTTIPVTIGAWQHVALSFDDSIATLYVNGVVAGTHPYAQGNPGVASYIIGKSNANPLYFHGQLYDVRFYDSALGATDVAHLHAGEPLSGPSSVPLPTPSDAASGTETARARAWLHTNCAGCHRPGGNGQGGLDLRFDTPFAQAGVCNVVPQYGTAGIPAGNDPRLVVPGAPARSVLLARLASASPTWRMPPISSHVVEEPGVALIQAFITALPPCP